MTTKQSYNGYFAFYLFVKGPAEQLLKMTLNLKQPSTSLVQGCYHFRVDSGIAVISVVTAIKYYFG